MAPVRSVFGHQLGEATIRFRRILLEATLPLCLILTLYATGLEARTEPATDSWGELSTDFLTYERPSLQDSVVLSSLSPSATFFSSSPAGRLSNKDRIQIPSQPSVQKFINFYAGQGRATFKEALGRSWYYVPVMSEILESCGVPAEMVYVVLVESCFRRQASYRGAGGYWQLLGPTARSLGLRVDKWVDERKDPVKSTQAAGKYLKAFHDQFGSWTLALAAYNAGAGPIMNATGGGSDLDFWDVCKRGRLSRTTREYVPKVLAAIEVVRNLEAYGFKRPRYFQVYDFEPIWVKSPLRLEQVARWIGVPLSRLRELNPSLSQDRMPPDSGFTLHLPSGARDKFEMAYDDYLRN